VSLDFNRDPNENVFRGLIIWNKPDNIDLIIELDSAILKASKGGKSCGEGLQGFESLPPHSPFF